MAKKSAATAVATAPAKKSLKPAALPALKETLKPAAKPAIKELAKGIVKEIAKPIAKPIAKAAAKIQPLKADIAALPRAIGHIIVYVKNWDASLNWYKNVLGLSTKFESEGWAEFSTEGAVLALHGLDACCAEGHESRNTGICFNVVNVQQTLSILRERAVKIVAEPREVCENTLCAEIADFEGNILSIVGK